MGEYNSMSYTQNKIKITLTLVIIGIMITGTILPSTLAASDDLRHIKSFDKGISWQPMVPLKKATFVNFCSEEKLDDYAYLAAVPTAVFTDIEEKRTFSNPLLYYQDEMIIEDEKERSLNARQGIDYFMEDWVSYCGGTLDQLTLINVQKNQIDPLWKSRDTKIIEGENPYDLAVDIAKNDWSFTDNAVVAIIDEEFEEYNKTTQNILEGVLDPEEGIKYEHFEIEKTNKVYPEHNKFNVPEGYKFMTVRSWYPSFYIDLGIPGFFEGIVNMSIPAGDRDLQIYCDYNNDGNYMMAGITNAWNAQGGMDLDKTSVYVYKSGSWSVALTDVPTKNLDTTWGPLDDIKKTGFEVQKHHRLNLLNLGFGRYGKFIDILKNIRQVVYQIDIEMYPGTMLEIPEQPPYGCRNASFELDWDDSSAKLGFSIIGPGGEEVLSTREPGVSSKCTFPESEGSVAVPTGTENELTIERLGECVDGEHYQICVFAMNDVAKSTDFTIKYSWEQNFSRQEGDNLASATNGAVLASALNAPLLYCKSSDLHQSVSDILYELGVKNLYIMDIGGYLNKQTKNMLDEIANIQNHFTEYENMYQYIRDLTGQNDIIFTTVDPYSYWHVAELKAAGEMPGGLAVGPAAYIAAQHASPVIVIDNHPELSKAVVWHNELWRRHPDGHSKLPTVSEMYLTGLQIIDFLKDNNYDKEGEETIITLGGQFDIGLPWDRVFVGKGKPGRFLGSPTDLSVWVTKNIFYPQIVFENPAFNQNGIKLINGSSSVRLPLRGKKGLLITKQSGDETFEFPVLDTLICYDHKFNSRASKYWGFTYITADGDIPGETASFEPIDDGVMLAVNGEPGGFLPDLSGSEVQPFYLRKAGYDPVYSTSFQANMENLNRGVLLWMVNTHGAPSEGGMFMFWDVKAENPRGYPSIPFTGASKEINPWRGYEWLMGSTAEPDTMTSEIHGFFPALTGNPDPVGPRFFTSAFDWALAKRPLRDAVGILASLPIIKWFTPEWLQDTQDYYDGVIITIFLGRFGTSWYNGSQVDDEIGNIHSAGVSSVACLPAGKYLHLTLMRHGSPFQIMDPWATSWYSDVWQNMVPRGIALGENIGEIYSEGISKVGILYVGGNPSNEEEPQWWWDLAENVCLYGDPDLRIWCPSTEYSSNNHWESTDVQPLRYDPDEGLQINGHMPFGSDGHPNARQPASVFEKYFEIILIAAIAIIVILAFIVLLKKKN